jgi:hypothetical protein
MKINVNRFQEYKSQVVSAYDIHEKRGNVIYCFIKTNRKLEKPGNIKYDLS